MEEKELNEFSWAGFFMVTSISSFVFMGVIKFLDGSNSVLFLAAGFTALLLSVVSWFGKAIKSHKARKQPNKKLAS